MPRIDPIILLCIINDLKIKYMKKIKGNVIVLSHIYILYYILYHDVKSKTINV